MRSNFPNRPWRGGNGSLQNETDSCPSLYPKLALALEFGNASVMPEPGLPQEGRGTLAQLIRDELARRRMSRAQLATLARISLSSLEKALSGQRAFTSQLLVRIEDVLNLRLRSVAETQGQHAPDWLGSYARPAVGWIEGEYLTLRPSATSPDAIYGYRTEITWDIAASHLVFREHDRLDQDYTQAGAVSIPHQTGHIYLITNRHGQYRMAVLSRPSVKGEMFGILTTLQAGRGAALTPAAMPIALLPAATAEVQTSIGKIERDHVHYATYSSLLNRTLTDGYLFMHQPPLPLPTRP